MEKTPYTIEKIRPLDNGRFCVLLHSQQGWNPVCLSKQEYTKLQKTDWLPPPRGQWFDSQDKGEQAFYDLWATEESATPD